MILKIVSRILLAGLLVISSISVAAAQSKQPIGLLADTVDYDPKTKVLTARGNIRVVSNGQILSADRVIYTQTTGKLTIPGGFTITNADGSVFTGTDATLSSNLSVSLIKGARVLIEGRFQLAADQAQYKDNRFKVLDRVVGSTCYVCKSDPIPFWQIRSKRVVHDEMEKQLYFENARLEFLGVPIFYAPRLRLPDPSVNRATGFLVPSFLTSDVLNFGVRIPYFIEIGDHSDATVTAFVSTIGSFVMEGQYRRETQKGKYQLDGALLLVDGIDDERFRSSLTGAGRFRLPNDYEWGFAIDVASDKDFRTQYGYEYEDSLSAQDRLLSELYLERNRSNSFLKVSTSIFESLRTNEIDAEIPLIFPNVYYRGIQDDPMLGGKLGFTAQSTTLLRSGSNRFSRAGFEADWQREWQFPNGLVLGTLAQVDTEYYSLSDSYTGFSGSTATRIIPVLSTDIRWPLAKVVGNATHVIEPIVQIVWTENSLTATPNEDSVQVEFEETNLFSTNRFPGFDQKELGLRANVGVNYSRYNPSGWNFGATAGRIFRNKDLGQFSTASGLAGQNSDWVSAFTFGFHDTFELTNRTLFDSRFNLSKNETSVSFVYKKLKGAATYIHLEQDVIAGASDSRSEAALELIFTPNENWSYLAEWRHDFITGSAREGDFGIKYTNECVKIDLSLSLQYAASGNIGSIKELGLRVSLIGIGNQARAERRRNHCAF